MSIDYIFLPSKKAADEVLTLEDIEVIEDYGKSKLEVLAKKLFPDFKFENELGRNSSRDISCELYVTEGSIHTGMSGKGDICREIARAVEIASVHYLIAIDIQTTELLKPGVSFGSAYSSWYKKVLANETRDT
ncbi:hypothetical protein ACJJID_11515 [Microbulbifer sp. CnH-101-G]|uniref:hypothetical protein n=1 Tax=Microbulbifer sp. CnH-101-G TaxID=3243393 RepID=UPI004039D1AE